MNTEEQDKKRFEHSRKISISFLLSLLAWPFAFIVSGMMAGSGENLSQVYPVYYSVLFYPGTVLVSFFVSFLFRKKSRAFAAFIFSLLPIVHVVFGLGAFLVMIFVPIKISDSDPTMCLYMRGDQGDLSNYINTSRLSCVVSIGPGYEEASILVKSGSLGIIPKRGDSLRGIISAPVLWDVGIGEIEIKDDVNLDGYRDLRLISIEGARNYAFTYYLFDSKEGTFRQDPVLVDLVFPQFDKQKKTITTNPIDDEKEVYVFTDGLYKLQK